MATLGKMAALVKGLKKNEKKPDNETKRLSRMDSKETLTEKVHVVLEAYVYRNQLKVDIATSRLMEAYTY